MPHMCTTFKQLEKLAQNRETWRAYQPTRTQQNPPRRKPEPNKYPLRSQKLNMNTTTTTTTTIGTTTTYSPAALSSPPPLFPIFTNNPYAKAKKNAPKPTPRPPQQWTNRQRQAFGLTH